MICAAALLSALATLQDKHSVVVARDVPGDGANGFKSRIVCEGTVDLPEGSRLDLKIYYGPYEPGRDLQYRSVQVRNGAFSRDFFIFPERNLAGTYVMRIAFDPTLQSTRVRDALGPDARPWSETVRFRIGTPLGGEQDRARVLERLARDIRAIVTLADDLETSRRKAPETVDVEAWRRISTEPLQKAWSVAERAWKSPEFKALRLEEVSGAGLMDLYNRLKSIASGAAATLAAPRDSRVGEALRQVRTAFDRAARKHLDRLASEQISSEALLGLAGEVRRMLKDATGLTGEPLDAARKAFTGALLNFQAKAPAVHHAALVALASGSAPLFDESRPREEREKTFHDEVEPQMIQLMEELKRNRWE